MRVDDERQLCRQNRTIRGQESQSLAAGLSNENPTERVLVGEVGVRVSTGLFPGQLQFSDARCPQRLRQVGVDAQPPNGSVLEVHRWTNGDMRPVVSVSPRDTEITT